MRQIKFAQLSDLHLGIGFARGKLALPEHCARQRESELRRALQAFVRAALEEPVALVLLPGDLFHTSEPSQEEANFVIEELNRLHPIPTFIAPGNHDFYRRASIYNRESALHNERPDWAPRWQEHIHIFTEPGFSTQRMGDICVTGCAFREETGAGGSPLTGLRPPEDAAVAIVMFHGSLRGYPMPDEPEVLPFTEAELSAAGYDYAAVGHHHSGRLIADGDGRICGAYSGAPLALTAADEGEKSFILGRLPVAAQEPRGPARPTVEDIRQVRSDPRQIRRVAVDLTGISNASALEEQVRKGLEGVGAQDIVRLRLIGRYPPGLPPGLHRGSAPFQAYFYVSLEDESTPDYELPFGPHARPAAERPARSVEELFIERMHKRWDQASRQEEQQLIFEATQYGLAALRRDEVKLR